MKKRKLTKFLIILLAGILLIGNLSVSRIFAASNNGQMSSAERDRVLFTGNSMTFFNNSPEIFCRMVKAGTGKTIEPITCIYGYKTLHDHATCINAVIRTKGDMSKVEMQERNAFWDNYLDKKFSKSIYNGYKEQLLDSKGNVKRFGTVILQIFHDDGKGDLDGEDVAQSIEKVIKAMNSSQTTYVINVTYGRFRRGIQYSLQMQDRLDNAAKTGIERAKNTMAGKYKDILFCPTGRAFCNYQLAYGTSRAMQLEPEAYDIYAGWIEGEGAVNDLGYGDFLHPTHLGSYMTAACLYATLYGNPELTVLTYRGGITGSVISLNGIPQSTIDRNPALVYRNGAGFANKNVLKGAAKIAWKTANGEQITECKDNETAILALSKTKPVLRKIIKHDDGVQICWNASDGTTKYAVMRKTHGKEWTQIATVYGTAFYDTTTKYGYTYYYSVRCLHPTSNAFISKYNTKGIKYDSYKTPVLKSVKKTSVGRKLKWKAVKGVKWYAVIRKERGGTGKILKVTKKTAFTDRKAKSKKTYAYAVIGMDANHKRYVTETSNCILSK